MLALVPPVLSSSSTTATRAVGPEAVWHPARKVALRRSAKGAARPNA
jgi:hypothetical protein